MRFSRKYTPLMYSQNKSRTPVSGEKTRVSGEKKLMYQEQNPESGAKSCIRSTTYYFLLIMLLLSKK